MISTCDWLELLGERKALATEIIKTIVLTLFILKYRCIPKTNDKIYPTVFKGTLTHI